MPVIHKKNGTAIAIPFDETVAKNYVSLLPFELTPAQKKTAWEILQDLNGSTPMNRLLEGDVGAGKTVVAAFAAVMAARNRVQTAFMAPTELLARQHAQTLANLLEKADISVGLLTSAVKKSAKELSEKISVKTTENTQADSFEGIVVKGAREHNLKNISVKIPRNKITVFTGLSGSGKSSLAFDTVYAEGQRRYVESLSAYARNFLEQFKV